MTCISLIIFLLLALPEHSSSRHALHRHNHHHNKNLQKGFKITLQHVDSAKNLTKSELMQRAIKRGKHRLQRLTTMSLAAASGDSEVTAPVYAGTGEFLMKLGIGTPAETYSAIMDTGSDLIWTQCKPCKECYDQPTPIFDPKKSSSFSPLSCSSNLCEALPISSCNDGCKYFYAYGDYSSTEGVMATETFTFGETSASGIGFGCGEDNDGSGFSQGAGLVGLGRGPLSLVTQLRLPKFSYCLTSIDDSKSSTLLMGSLASGSKSTSEIITTPLIHNPSQPSFYYLSLEGITVGDKRLPLDKDFFTPKEDGSGGIIIDSGTTITYLDETAFSALKKEFISQTQLPADTTGESGLDLCFTLPSDATQVEVPKLIFHFQSGDLELPGDNYMISDSSAGVTCLAIGSSEGMSIFGNIQQQNMLVIHDLEKKTISFVPSECDKI